MNRILNFLGLRLRAESEFSRFFEDLDEQKKIFSSRERKQIIQKAIKAANRDQRDLVDRVEKKYSQ